MISFSLYDFLLSVKDNAEDHSFCILVLECKNIEVLFKGGWGRHFSAQEQNVVFPVVISL